MVKNTERAITNGNPEKLTTLSTQNTGRRQATKQQQNQTNKHKQKQKQNKANKTP